MYVAIYVTGSITRCNDIPKLGVVRYGTVRYIVIFIRYRKIVEGGGRGSVGIPVRAGSMDSAAFPR